MKEEKTILEWLKELPDGYRERALANMDPDLGNINICKDLPEATSRAFVWEKTPEEEGYDFWCAVYDWAEGNGDLPPLPEGGIMKATKDQPTPPGSGWREMIDALIETDKDLRILKNQLISAAKSNHRFEGMDSVVEGWIQRGRDALRKAGALRP